MNAELLRSGKGVFKDIDGGTDGANDWHAEQGPRLGFPYGTV